MIDPNARVRLENLAALHEDAARRFAGYHATSLANGEPSVWDARSLEEAQVANDLRSLLAELSPKPGEAEAIARIIDPDAWDAAEHYAQSAAEWRAIEPNGRLDKQFQGQSDELKAPSLAKAQAILKERYSG